MTYPVSLVFYDFKIFNYLPLSSLTHTEVVVHGKSFGFDDEDGITVVDRENLNGVYNYQIKQVIPLGLTKTTEDELKTMIRELSRDWTKAKYKLFTKNCRHFSKKLIQKLEPTDKDDGIELLDQLIYFGEIVGHVLTTCVRALLLRCLASPYHYLSSTLHAMNLVANGEIFNYPTVLKDCVLIFIICALFCYFVRKALSLFHQREDSDVEEICDQMRSLQF